MKAKKQKNNSNSYGKILCLTMALFIFLAVIFSILFFSIIQTTYKAERTFNNNYYANTESVEINTDKNIYIDGEKINIVIRNNEKQSIYFKPCEYLNTFEKKIEGKLKEENAKAILNDNDSYNKISFNKNKNITRCEVKSPESGEGIYRSVIQIYYDCIKPGYCKSSKVFYSNEFEIKGVVKGCGC